MIVKICVCLGILTVSILGNWLWQERRENDKIYSFWIQAGDNREIDEEFLQQIAERKGVRIVSAAWEIPVRLSIASYEMETAVLAVDMNVVPAAFKKCAEQLEIGSKIPMYLGSDSLGGLLDENRHPITEKQKKLLFDQGIGTEIVLQEISGMEETKKSLKTKGQIGVWAAELKEVGNQIWIGLEDGQKLVDSLKVTKKTCKIYIEVKGKINYQNLRSALEQTGMILQNE